jgi:hypothetical protein
MIGGEGLPVLRPSPKAQHRARPIPAQLGRLPLPRPPLRVRKAGPRIRRRLPVPPLTRMHGTLRLRRRRKPGSSVARGPPGHSARPLDRALDRPSGSLACGLPSRSIPHGIVSGRPDRMRNRLWGGPARPHDPSMGPEQHGPRGLRVEQGAAE